MWRNPENTVLTGVHQAQMGLDALTKGLDGGVGSLLPSYLHSDEAIDFLCGKH